MRAWTDYPIAELGDEPDREAPIRSCWVLGWDGDKYAEVIVGGVLTSFKCGYLYTEPGRTTPDGKKPPVLQDIALLPQDYYDEKFMRGDASEASKFAGKPPKMAIVVRTDLKMRAGKLVAQAGHAGELFLLDRMRAYERGEANSPPHYTDVEREWMWGGGRDIPGWDWGGMKKVALCSPGPAHLLLTHEAALAAGLRSFLVIDKQLGAFTCCAIGPDANDRIDAVIGLLRPLRDED